MTPIAPVALQKGDTIAFVSPSARMCDFVPWRVQRATSFFKEQGYHVKLIYNVDVPDNPLSANVAQRAAELHSAFLDPDVKAIICCIGGSTMNELLPGLDSKIVRDNPKILTGSSDITLLHHFCYVAGLRTFYGPSAITQFAEWPKPLAFTWDHFLKISSVAEPIGAIPRSPTFTDEFTAWEHEPQLLSEQKMRSRTMKSARGWRWLKPGEAEGELWGGCLPSILQMMGTKWEVSYDRKIAFIELPEGDSPGSGYALELAIWNFNDLRLKGILDRIVGLVVGRPYLYSPEEEQQWEDAIVRALEDYDFPVLVGVDVGHTDPMVTVPLGAKARLNSQRDLWEILESGVTDSIVT